MEQKKHGHSANQPGANAPGDAAGEVSAPFGAQPAISYNEFLSNNVKKSFVRWASHCVVCGPPVETERPARALKKKDVKKVQPVWLQVEQKREPVWLLLTFVNSFWLNSFLNSFPNSFWKFCTILTLLFLVPLYLCGHLCGGPPGPAVVPVLCHGFRG